MYWQTPDAFVKLGTPDTRFDTWKTWQGGTPDLCVEIVSPSDKEKQTLDEKLERFHAMGVAEVVAFDPDGAPGRRLRAWDLVDGDLVERVVDAEATPCLTLGLWFVIAPVPTKDLDHALRLAEDARGHGIVLTPTERALAEKEAALAGEERERVEKERERAEKEAALAEIARLRVARGTRSKRPRKSR